MGWHCPRYHLGRGSWDACLLALENMDAQTRQYYYRPNFMYYVRQYIERQATEDRPVHARPPREQQRSWHGNRREYSRPRTNPRERRGRRADS